MTLDKELAEPESPHTVTPAESHCELSLGFNILLFWNVWSFFVLTFFKVCFWSVFNIYNVLGRLCLRSFSRFLEKMGTVTRMDLLPGTSPPQVNSIQKSQAHTRVWLGPSASLTHFAHRNSVSCIQAFFMSWFTALIFLSLSSPECCLCVDLFESVSGRIPDCLL